MLKKAPFSEYFRTRMVTHIVNVAPPGTQPLYRPGDGLHRGPCPCQLQICSSALTPRRENDAFPSPWLGITISLSIVWNRHDAMLFTLDLHVFGGICLTYKYAKQVLTGPRYTKRHFLEAQRYAIAYLRTCSRRACCYTSINYPIALDSGHLSLETPWLSFLKSCKHLLQCLMNYFITAYSAGPQW